MFALISFARRFISLSSFSGLSRICLFRNFQRFSYGFMSGECLGHFITLMLWFLNYARVTLVVCFGSLSCRNIQSGLSTNFWTDDCKQTSVILISSTVGKISPNHDVIITVFHSRDGVILTVDCSILSPYIVTSLWPKKSILLLSDHKTFLKWSLSRCKFVLAQINLDFMWHFLNMAVLRVVGDFWLLAVMFRADGLLARNFIKSQFLTFLLLYNL